jgi:hypothetical protein
MRSLSIIYIIKRAKIVIIAARLLAFGAKERKIRSANNRATRANRGCDKSKSAYN